jgi:thioredoxin reductase (NADPH)
MTKPILLTVDDDPEVLSAIERDLRERYREDYLVLKARSGEEALQAAVEVQQRGKTIALFLVDQRMPGMTGTELLVELRKLFPEARRVLLTAYADTAAAIASINEIGLDHYLLKPWDPPEERLYPVLDDLGRVEDIREAAVRRHTANRRPVVAAVLPGKGIPGPQSCAVPMARSRARGADP